MEVFKDLGCLIGEKDADFFSNLFNIKLQKRFKALRTLTAKIKEGHIVSQFSISKFALAIANLFIYTKPSAELKKRGVLANTKQHTEALQNESLFVYQEAAT